MVDVPFLQFLAPGLVMMAIAQNAFANTSSSLIIAKVQGNIVDTLMPPLTPLELTLGFALGGVTRGLIVGAGRRPWRSALVRRRSASTTPWPSPSTPRRRRCCCRCSASPAGIWAEKFDQIAAVTNFIVTPLSFLSGTFYSVDRLPPLFSRPSPTSTRSST